MYKMMIVDDEKQTRDYMKNMIPQLHKEWEVTAEAEDGMEALEQFVKQKVDLIITDIKMPLMNGLQLCQHVRTQQPSQKIVILSGYDEFSLVKEAMRHGIKDYLLKPLVKSELQQTMIRITNEIEIENSQELADRDTKKLSVDSKKHIVRNFLKALVTDSNVEVKALYPLLFKLKISLINTVGLIIVMALDEDIVMSKSIPSKDIPSFQFILNNMATEIVEDKNKGKVSLDQEGNTIILVTGENNEELTNISNSIHDEVSNAMLKYTGITITSATGSIETEVLQLGQSYEKAKRKLSASILENGGKLYNKLDVYLEIQFTKLEEAVSHISTGLSDSDDMGIYGAVKQYVEIYKCHTDLSMFRCGSYLIKSMIRWQRSIVDGALDAALSELQSFGLNHHKPEQDQVIAFLQDTVKRLVKASRDEPGDELDIVKQAKEYIFTYYSEPISLALVAEKIGVSPNYLSSVFHKKMGESYIKFLTRVRMEHAAKLFKANPYEKVYFVSEQVGYMSGKHFSQVFKLHFQVTPGEYQAQFIKQS